jgi:hypothetical protein
MGNATREVYQFAQFISAEDSLKCLLIAEGAATFITTVTLQHNYAESKTAYSKKGRTTPFVTGGDSRIDDAFFPTGKHD